MTDTLSKAILMATIGLPVMIGVIGLFALVARGLVLLFPRDGEAEQKH